MFLWNKKYGVDQDNPIGVGDCILNRESFPNMNKYFDTGPLKVTKITDAPDYAGGKFIFVNYGSGEKGFYLNAVKKVSCC